MSAGSTGAKVVALKIDSKSDLKRAERALLARLPAPIHAVQQKGKQVMAGLLRTLFDKADDSLFELADRAVNNQDQNLYFESMREVRLKRRTVETHFADHIDSAFARTASAEVQEQVDDSYASDQEFSMDNLSLVKNDELEELVATDSMIVKANERFAEPIQHLTLRLDSLTPQKIYQKNNPLGPDVLCAGFVDATGCMTLDIKARLVLFKLFDRLVVTELSKLYDEANKVLVEHKVLPSLKGQLRQSRQVPTAPRRSSAASGNTAAGSAQSDNEVLATLQQLLADQRGDAESSEESSLQFSEPAAGGSTIASGDVMRLLSQIQQRELPAQHSVKSLLNQLLAGRDDGRKLGQLDDDVINLVNMMFEFILDDRNLAPPMKAILGRLQIPLLKVAIADKSFFGKGGHPARRLLNELATAALGWQGDGGDKDTLYRKIDGVVQKLISEFESDVNIFSELLTDFVSFVEKERRRASILEQRTLDAEDGKARAEQARKLVGESISSVVGSQQLPDAVTKLLRDAWGNVLFLICLKHDVDSDEWREAVQTAVDLVWSVSAPVDKEARARMLILVPDLLKRLRAGLESVSFNPFEMTQLFKQLQAIHLQKLKAPLETNAEKVAQSSARPTEKTSSAAVAANENDIALPQASKSSAKVVDEVGVTAPAGEAAVSKPTAVPAAAEQSGAKGAAVELDDNDAFLVQVKRMSPGGWFENKEGAQNYRCRLAAVIKATGKYIFVNRAGMKVAEKTAQEFAQAIKSGKLQSLDDGMLFDRALEAVIGNLRNRGD